MTYRELKNFCNTLTKKQLQQEVKIWGEGISKQSIAEIDVLKEDMINPSGDGAEPISAYKDDPEYAEGEAVVAKKGEIILHVNDGNFDTKQRLDAKRHFLNDTTHKS